jgi:hypothetical protein
MPNFTFPLRSIASSACSESWETAPAFMLYLMFQSVVGLYAYWIVEWAKIASHNGNLTFTKLSQTCVIGWTVIASEVTSSIDIALLFGENFHLNRVREIMIYHDYNIFWQRVSMSKKYHHFFQMPSCIIS